MSLRRVYAVDGQAIMGRFEVIMAQVRSVASICCPPASSARTDGKRRGSAYSI